MKILITFSAIVLILNSCKKDNSELNKPCNSMCTTISGRVTTGNNSSITNFQIEVSSDLTTLLGQATRGIASGKTDNNGYYSFTFKLMANEFGQNATASVYLQLKYDSSKFLALPVYQNGGNKEYIGRFSTNDTTIMANVYLATKSKINVKLYNFVPIVPSDYFKVVTICNVGLNKNDRMGYSFTATQNTTEEDLYASGNDETEVIATKTKNGIITSIDTTIYTPIGQVVALSFPY
jgi:hypothetical protein